MRFSEDPEHIPNRVIPIPTYDPVDTSMFPRGGTLGKSDFTALQNIANEFVETGVLERPAPKHTPQSVAELDAMVKEAIALSKSEKELNPDGYDADAEAELGEDLDSASDWVNPSLDGIDDYGRQVYRNSTTGLPTNPA